MKKTLSLLLSIFATIAILLTGCDKGGGADGKGAPAGGSGSHRSSAGR